MTKLATPIGMFALLLLAIAVHGQDSVPVYVPVAGDVLFLSMPHGPLVDAIEGTTHSPYSHSGIVVGSPGKWYVLEAIGPVKETDLAVWIAQARDGAFDAYRLRPRYRDKIPAFIAAARQFLGRPYDIHYRFDDESIYCSELVFEAFQKATGEPLGKVKRLEELDWKPFVPVIQAIEGGPVPLQREMITPADLANATQLYPIYQGIKQFKTAPAPAQP